MKWSILVASTVLSCLVTSAQADVVGSTELVQLERFASHHGHRELFGPAHGYGPPSWSGGCCEYVHSHRDHVWDDYCNSRDSHECEAEPHGHHSCDLGCSQCCPAPAQCVSRCDHGCGSCGGGLGLLKKLLSFVQCDSCPGAGSSCDSYAAGGCDGSAIGGSVHDHADYNDGMIIQEPKAENGKDIPPAPPEVTPPQPAADSV